MSTSTGVLLGEQKTAKYYQSNLYPDVRKQSSKLTAVRAKSLTHPRRAESAIMSADRPRRQRVKITNFLSDGFRNDNFGVQAKPQDGSSKDKTD